MKVSSDAFPDFLKQLRAMIKTWVLHSYVYISEMGVHILTLSYVSYKAKKLIISLALIGQKGDAGCVLFYNLFHFLAIKREDAA